MRNLDQLDLDILAHLFRDAGMTNKDLAALVGVAPSTCLERVRKLQQDGVLKGAHCEVDYQALGGHIQAMVSLQLARHSRQIMAAFRDAILALPEVISLFHMGGKDDFLVHLCVADTEHLRNFVCDHFTSREEVVHLCVSDTAHLRNFVFDHFTSREEVVHLETSLVFEHKFSRSLPCFLNT